MYMSMLKNKLPVSWKVSFLYESTHALLPVWGVTFIVQFKVLKLPV